MKVKEILNLFEKIAPSSYQESYDNSGLITGHPEDEVKGILLSLDTTEAVVDEAIAKGCNLIVAHHPIIFKGLKRLNGSNYVERVVIKAIRNHVAILAVHTNLDNVLRNGVNEKIANKLSLSNLSILSTKSGFLSKIFVYVTDSHLDVLRNAMFEAGGGHIGEYSECSFTTQGQGTFKPGVSSKPFFGKNEELSSVRESKLEMLVPSNMAERIISAAKVVHPYEEMAYEIVPLSNRNQELGSGVIGELEKPMDSGEFLAYLKERLKLEVIRFTGFEGKVRRVAVCGGSGSFLIHDARRAKADAYVTADVKYHEFFDAESELMICDVGHYESEISTLEIFYDVIKEKFPNFAVIFCGISTNPIQYYT